MAVSAAGGTRVLYIGGTGRTSSTLVEKVLGQYDGIFAAGELAFLWRFGLQAGGRCSCGKPLRACDVWASVLGTDVLATVDAAEMARLRRRFNSRHLPLMVSPSARRALLRRLGPFSAALEELYASIRRTTGSRVIVDASKEPHYSFILDSLPSLDVRFLHLVRDPRAVARSWQRDKKEIGLPGDASMERRSPPVSALYYDVSNAAAEWLWRRHPDRYLRLRYEDFVRRPGDALRAIGTFIGEELDPDMVLSGRSLRLRPTHSAWGNPNRFEHGDIPLRADTAWMATLPWRDRAVMTALTFPFMRRYGYSVGRDAASTDTVVAVGDA